MRDRQQRKETGEERGREREGGKEDKQNCWVKGKFSPYGVGVMAHSYFGMSLSKEIMKF
jgi:hypothetical protein